MPLPIKASEYSHCMELLSSLSIGDALNKDCKVEELTRAYPTLRCLEGCKVNIDELDYLAKRLDGFDAVEVSQFQAMADKLKLTDMKDLINLTFSCQQATVIADFSDLESVGRAHYMNTHDGCASAEELDLRQTADGVTLYIYQAGLEDPAAEETTAWAAISPYCANPFRTAPYIYRGLTISGDGTWHGFDFGGPFLVSGQVRRGESLFVTGDLYGETLSFEVPLPWEVDAE